MKKKKIFYVFGFGDTPDSIYVKYLKEHLDSSKYEVISDYYAQYSHESALTDIENYIEKYNIDILIGEHLGAYLLTLLNTDKNITIIASNPLQWPAGYELDEYEIPSVDEKGNECVMKMVPKHIVNYYKSEEFKQNFNKKICFVFDNNRNLEYYKNIIKDPIINPIYEVEASYKYITDSLNSL